MAQNSRKNEPLVSIVLVTYKEDAELLACLQSIFRTQRESDDSRFEVIVADNNIERRLEPVIAKRFPEVKYVSAGDNIGFGPANNVGARQATGEFIFFLNPDTELEPGAVRALSEFLQSQPAAAVVAPTLYDMEGNFYPDQGSAELTPWTALAAHSVLHRVWPENPGARAYWVKDRDTSLPQKLAVVPGTAFMIRRSVFEEIGGFDERFFIYFEESDLCRRVRAAGYEVWLTPESRVRHIWHAATQDAKYNRIYRESRFKYFEKYNGLVVATALEYFLKFGKRQAVYLGLGGCIALFLVLLGILLS